VSTKKEPENVSDSLLVDQNEIFWNTFFDIILEWAPILKQIYEIEDNKR
jgi:hypothetical protein